MQHVVTRLRQAPGSLVDLAPGFEVLYAEIVENHEGDHLLEVWVATPVGVQVHDNSISSTHVVTTGPETFVPEPVAKDDDTDYLMDAVSDDDDGEMWGDEDFYVD